MLTELIKTLKEDSALFYAWQANIAMSYKDTEANYIKLHKKKTLNKEDKHEIANEAAKRFLNQLIK